MRTITHIKVSNLLSFGFKGLDLELRDLNVLIGPNGSGKSNFLEIFEILKSLPKNEEDSHNLRQIISQGGGPKEWACKAFRMRDEPWDFPFAEFEIEYADDILFKGKQLKHQFSIDWKSGTASIIYSEEIIEETATNSSTSLYYTKKNPFSEMSVWNEDTEQFQSYLPDNYDLSILSRRYSNSGIFSLGDTYEKIRLYREWSFGRNTIFRVPQRADLRNDRLEVDFSNLAMFLSRLRKHPGTKRALVLALQDLYDGLTDFEIITEGGSVQIFFTEGDFSIPATRLSDGSLRYLCLLAILLDPTPPPLICIEEPELGLHPDLLPKIADLLVAASSRTQLIVTTHSDVLIDALSDQPESVLVCEKQEGRTQITRLERSEIAHWLDNYRLGQLWTRGEIGGTRW